MKHDYRSFAPAMKAAGAYRSDAADRIRRFVPMVRRLAWHVHGQMSTSVEVEDLVQVGLVALVEALAAADVRSGHEFRQYLATRLRGAMIDELRRHALASRGAMRRRREHARAAQALAGELGRAPTDAEVETCRSR